MTNSFFQEIKAKTSNATWKKLEAIANREVGLALRAEIFIDPSYARSKYHRLSYFFPDIFNLYSHFYISNVGVSPWEIINILFRCKLIRIVKSQGEFDARTGGGGSFVDSSDFRLTMQDAEKEYADLITERFEILKKQTENEGEKAVIVAIWNFDCYSEGMEGFTLEMEKRFPGFHFLFTSQQLVDFQKRFDIGMPLSNYTPENARQYLMSLMGNFFAIAYVGKGGDDYVSRYALPVIKMLCDFFRIFGFIYPYQRDSGGDRDYRYDAPIGYSLICSGSTNSHGCFLWREERKPLVDRHPDGNLFLSFGFRSIARLHLDVRTFPAYLDLFDKHKTLFNVVLKPYTGAYTNDVLPIIHLLSTASQVQDYGGKVLLLMCCLEHMYAKDGFRGIKSITKQVELFRPDLVSWILELYRLRCEYAHNGYLSGISDLNSFAAESMKNCLELLQANIKNT